MKIINLLTGEQNTGISPHATTHHAGGTDEISAEAIGARPANQFIPWEHISGAPIAANPPLNFTPLTTPGGELIVVLGALPIAVTPADPPVGNEGQPCWQSLLGIQTWRTSFYLTDTPKTFRATAFARTMPGERFASTLSLSIRGLDNDGNFIVLNILSLNLGLTINWSQYDFQVSSGIYQQIALFINNSSANQWQFQIYAPQLSVVV